MKFSEICYSTSDKKNQFRVALWCFAWAFSWVLTTRIIKSDLQPRNLLVIGAALLTLGFGLVLIRSYRKFLREADELLRKIELDALAMGVGVALIGGSVYQLLQRAYDLTFFDPFNATLLMFCITYMVSSIAGYRRFL